MHPLNLLAVLPLTLAASISPRQAQLQWRPCDPNLFDATKGILCSSFDVPLDYNNPAAGTATLGVAKIPASGTKQGTIFFNPGGPGIGGVPSFTGYLGQQLFNVTGRSFDIITWDPRGTGSSKPFINCFPPREELGLPTSTSFNSWLANNATLFTKTSGPTQGDIDKFLAKTGSVEAKIQEFVNNCTQKHSDILKYLGTAATTRDLIALANVVEGEGSKINYYGISYGATLGIYLMKMFPSRLGKVVLDSPADADAYTSRPGYMSYTSSIGDSDGALHVFYDACAKAGPSADLDIYSPGCSLARQGSTAQEVQQRVHDIVDLAYDYANRGLTSFTLEAVQSPLKGFVFAPRLWQFYSHSLVAAGQTIQAALSGNSSGSSGSSRRGIQGQVLKRQLPNSWVTDVDSINSVIMAIECGDAIDSPGSATTRSVFEETIRATRDVSRLHGPFLSTYLTSYCHLWPYRAIERNISTSTIEIPGNVLVIANTYAAWTPLNGAVRLVQKLNAGGSKKATLIQHDGAGQSSMDLRSACTEDIIRRYYGEGHVPPTDTLCGVNEAPAFKPYNAIRSEGPSPGPTSIISAPLSLPTGAPSASSSSAIRLSLSAVVLVQFAIIFTHLIM